MKSLESAEDSKEAMTFLVSRLTSCGKDANLFNVSFEKPSVNKKTQEAR